MINLAVCNVNECDTWLKFPFFQLTYGTAHLNAAIEAIPKLHRQHPSSETKCWVIFMTRLHLSYVGRPCLLQLKLLGDSYRYSPAISLPQLKKHNNLCYNAMTIYTTGHCYHTNATL